MAKSEVAAAAIAALYAKKPGATLEQFMQVASEADAAVAGMPKRSFNATYLLPMKRSAAPKKPRKARAVAAKTAKPGRKAAAVPARRAVVKRAPKTTAAFSGNGGASAARRLVLERDQQLLNALRSGGDPKAAYALAASVDEFVAELVSALRR